MTLGIDVGKDLGSEDWSSGSFNDGKLEGLFLTDTLGYADGKVLVCY